MQLNRFHALSPAADDERDLRTIEGASLALLPFATTVVSHTTGNTSYLNSTSRTSWLLKILSSSTLVSPSARLSPRKRFEDEVGVAKSIACSIGSDKQREASSRADDPFLPLLRRSSHDYGCRHDAPERYDREQLGSRARQADCARTTRDVLGHGQGRYHLAT